MIFVVLSTWKRGNEVLEAPRIEGEGPLQQFVEEVRPLAPPVAAAAGRRSST